MAHRCHAHGCNVEVPPRMLACKPHWYALPKFLRDAVWREYRNGQEEHKRVTWRYMAVQRLAVSRLARDEHGVGPAALRYWADALRYREKAILNGEGDPLQGLVPPSDLPVVHRFVDDVEPCADGWEEG